MTRPTLKLIYWLDQYSTFDLDVQQTFTLPFVYQFDIMPKSAAIVCMRRITHVHTAYTCWF